MAYSPKNAEKRYVPRSWRWLCIAHARTASRYSNRKGSWAPISNEFMSGGCRTGLLRHQQLGKQARELEKLVVSLFPLLLTSMVVGVENVLFLAETGVIWCTKRADTPNNVFLRVGIDRQYNLEIEKCRLAHPTIVKTIPLFLKIIPLSHY